MSNSKFLRFVFKRQAKFEENLSRIMTTIYNAEIESENPIEVICILPSPLMLNINNLNQIMDLVNQQAQTMAQIEYSDNNDPDIENKRAIFVRNYIHFKLGGYLKQNEIENIKNISDLEFARIKQNNEE